MHQTSTMMEFGALVRCQTNQKSGLTEAIVNWIRQLPLREGFTSAAFFVGGSDVKNGDRGPQKIAIPKYFDPLMW